VDSLLLFLTPTNNIKNSSIPGRTETRAAIEQQGWTRRRTQIPLKSLGSTQNSPAKSICEIHIDEALPASSSNHTVSIQFRRLEWSVLAQKSHPAIIFAQKAKRRDQIQTR
jgi:hypothetical protein